MPEICSNRQRQLFRFLRCDSSQSEKRIVSSAYWREIIPLGVKSVRSPLIKPSPAAFSSILVKTSTTRLKRRGEMGSPCLSPYPGLKKELSSPFRFTPTEPPLTRRSIHFIQVGLKFLVFKISKRKSEEGINFLFPTNFFRCLI